jgi:hypothetical protein
MSFHFDIPQTTNKMHNLSQRKKLRERERDREGEREREIRI